MAIDYSAILLRSGLRKLHVRHHDETLFKLDLVVHQPNKMWIIDLQICWEVHQPLSISWTNKQMIYNNENFLHAAQTRWLGSGISVLPLVVGARGIWPAANRELENILKLTPAAFKQSVICSTLKWGSSMHRHFTAAIGRTRRPRR